jgi:rubrerythrin
MEALAKNAINYAEAMVALAELRDQLWQDYAEKAWKCLDCDVSLTSDGLYSTSHCPSCGKVNRI